MATKVAERRDRRRNSQTIPVIPSPAIEGKEELLDLAEWIRLPPPGGRCPRTGLSRSSYNDHIFCDPPQIKSVVLKKPGARRGVRLVHWPSTNAFLHRLMEQQTAEAASGEGGPMSEFPDAEASRRAGRDATYDNGRGTTDTVRANNNRSCNERQSLTLDENETGRPVTPPTNGADPIESAEFPPRIQCSRSSESVAAESVSKGVESFVIPEGINSLSLPEAIRFYIDQLDLPVIPLHPITSTKVEKPGKAPMIRGYRQMTVSDMNEDYLREWFPERTDHNLGATLQPPLVWIDLDAKLDEGNSAEEWLDRNPAFQKCPRVRTKHGFHIPVVVRDLPANTKKLAHPVSDKLIIEVIPPTHPVTLPPSLRVDGKPYLWERTGEIPEFSSLQDLLTRLEIPEKKPGRPRKPRTLAQRFKGDLRTLDLAALLREKKMLGDCLDKKEGKHAARCPWEHEHSERHEDIQSDTVVWTKPGETPGFKCLHGHCEDRKIEQLLEWLEEQDPGSVDRFCIERRAYGRDECEDESSRPLIEHTGDNRLISVVASELAAIIAPKYQWFRHSNSSIVEVTKDPKTDRLVFREITATAACGDIERFVVPVVPRPTKDGIELVPHSFDSKELAHILKTSQFIDSLPVIDRILPFSLPILNSDDEIVLPQPGYDPNLRTY